MLSDIDLNQLTEAERDQILQVLRRDDELRKKEQERIRKLKNEVKQLRLKGVIREGQDANKTCARCRQSLGWFFNTGALCPNCKHKVCEKCRQYKDKNTWICVLCFKQMELEAMTNHWFYSKFRKSKRSKKTNRVISGSEIVRTSIRKSAQMSQDGTVLAGNSLTEEVKRALYNSNPNAASKLVGDGENSDTQSTEGAPSVKRLDRVAFPEEEDRQMLMELIKPRRQNPDQPMVGQHHVEVKRVTSNRYRDSDSDSDSCPSSPQPSSRNESMFTHTDSLRSSLVSSDGRITMVTDVGGFSDMEVASVDTMAYGSASGWEQEEEHCLKNARSHDCHGSASPDSRKRGALIRGHHGAPGSSDPEGSRSTDACSTPVYEEGYGHGAQRDYRQSPSSDYPLQNATYRDNTQRHSSSKSYSCRDSPQSSHPDQRQREDNFRDSRNRLQPHGDGRGRLSPQKNSPQLLQSGQRFSPGPSATNRKAGSPAYARDMPHRQLSTTSTDSESVLYTDARRRHQSDYSDGSRSPSPDDRHAARESRSMAPSGASVANGHLAPPGKQQKHQRHAHEAGDRLVTAVAVEQARTRTPSGNQESVGNDSQDEKSRAGSLRSAGVTASPLSNRSAMSAGDDDIDEEENIDELFQSHASVQSFTDSKHSSNLLSPFTTSRESIASYYSDAGEGNYGKIPVTGEVQFGLDYNYKNNIFEIHVKQCRDLAPVDTKRKRSDPYVKTYLLPDKTKSGKRKTRVKKHTLNPTFDETLRYQITKSELENRTLWLTVWHNDTFGRNDFLGEVNIPMDEYTFTKSTPRWYPLQDRFIPQTDEQANSISKLAYKGDLVVSLKFVTCDYLMNKRRGRGSERGELHVLIKEARNLTAVRSNGTSDPFCKGYLLPEKSKHAKQKTPVKKKDCNPVWNHTFLFEDIAWADLKERCLELTVWDHDRFTSNDFLGGVRLGLGTGTSGGRPVDWMDSQGEEVTIWKSMLERPNVWIDGTLILRPSMEGRK